ncbi:hypothetical protein CYY_001731 [Polysphondylium violaceum]|uniref:non-specific serine/threonine protein kinase n=1 Tax=Polysphondylium violaceum TaxID=133409 RepID=A0A8J4Q0K6_9MYCE|nr:hypothetical protein CYY_001731 [Polysphondylium violaceum]
MNFTNQADPLDGFTVVKDLRSGGEGKAILLKKNEVYYVCKERKFDSLAEATIGLNEAYSLASINHPNVVKLEGVSVFEREKQVILCIIMEYCPKGDLLDFLLEISLEKSLTDTDSISSKTSTTSSSNEDLIGSGSISPTPSIAISTPQHRPSTTPTSLSPTLSGQLLRPSSNSVSSLPPLSSSPSSSHMPPTHIKKSQSPSSSNLKGNKSQTQHQNSKKCVVKLTKDLTKAPFSEKKNKNGEYEIYEETIQSNEFNKTVKNTNDAYLIEQNQLIEWLLQLCYGVQALHKQHLIHRDLKSENIFISSNNSLKIGDFGLAYKTTGQSGNAKGVVGTYLYSAPEVLEGKAYDKSADIFSLGCIFYEMITLKNLYQNRVYIAQEMIDDTFCMMGFHMDFPQKFQKLCPIVLRMLDRNPNLRPSIENLIEQFEKMDSSVLREKILIPKKEGVKTFKGINKQLEKEQFPEAARLLAGAYIHDPRFNTIFPASEPASLGHLTSLFEWLLKIIGKNKAAIWGAFTFDNRMVSVMVWFNPDKLKKIKLSYFIIGGITFIGKFGLRKVRLVSALMKFIDEALLSGGGRKEKYWFLAYVATNEEYRNSGVGSQLLSHILSWADHSQFRCLTFSFSKAPIPFFERLCFNIIQEVTKNLPNSHLTHFWVLERQPKQVDDQLFE